MLAPPRPPETELNDSPVDPASDRVARPAETIRGVFEPPSGFVARAIGRNKVLILACAIVLGLIGAAVGTKRQVTYTSSATLQVGQVNPNSPGFLGYVQSSASLATAFSRSIDAEPVLATVQTKLGLTLGEAVARLSAEPIPQAPAFQVIATGSSERAAVGLANVAAQAVIAYEGKSNSDNPEAESLLHEYREASYRLQQVAVELGHLAQKKGASPEARARAEAAKNAAEVRLKAVGNSYIAAVTSQAPRNGLVSLLAGAAGASDNRSSKIELLGLIGVLAGIVVGCLAAVARERRRAGLHG